MPIRRNLLAKVWHWATGQIVQDVPINSALCAYDCRKGQCSSGEWETCERRLSQATGELMPRNRDLAGGTSKIGSFRAESTSAEDRGGAPDGPIHGGKSSDLNVC